MKQSLTIWLDQSVIHDAKVLAARRSISLSQFLVDQIQCIVAQESDYEHNRASALARLDKGYALGEAKMPKREEIYN